MTAWTTDDITRLKARGMVAHAPTITALPEYQEIFKMVKKKMLHEESAMQQNCVETFHLIYPKFRWRLFAIPNSGKRDTQEAERLLNEGMLPGALDLFLSLPRGKWHGMYMEAKIATGRLSENQIEFIKHNGVDYKCVVFRTVEQFLNEVKEYLSEK